MHDIDRTQRELELSMQELQPEYFEFANPAPSWGEMEGENFAGEAWQEMEMQETSMYEAGVLNEADEMELASELLEITNEAELDQFLGKLIRKVGSTVGRVVRSPIGRALGGIVKPLIKKALPIAGTALGSFVGGPVGGAIGGKLATAAGNMFGLELEGLSPEDREYEVARRVVRFAATATNNALDAPANAHPQVIARQATINAARQFAPGISSSAAPVRAANPNVEPPTGSRNRGTWVRRGRRIILFGV